MPDQDREVAVDDGAVDLHGVAELGETEVDHAGGVLGVVVDDVGAGESGERVAAEVGLELLPAVLAVQADRADEADVLGRDAGPLEVVEQLGEHDTPVGGLVLAALDAVGEGDGDGLPGADQVTDRPAAQGRVERGARGADGVGERLRLVVGAVRGDHHRVVGDLDGDVSVAVLQLDLHVMPFTSEDLPVTHYIQCAC